MPPESEPIRCQSVDTNHLTRKQFPHWTSKTYRIMGLKLKWFRRRITFVGIPSAPERNIRKKEHDTGITVIGVYRHSVNCEDYVEPTRSSYWEPPNVPIVTSVIRKPTTSATTISPSTSANKSSPRVVEGLADKITPASKVKTSSTALLNGRIETPPQPLYSPPQPPTRRAMAKTKSTPDITTIDNQGASILMHRSEIARSVEVLTEEIRPVRDNNRSPNPPTPQSRDKINHAREEILDDDFEQAQKPQGTVTPLKNRINRPESNGFYQHQQPEFFTEILEKVNDLARSPNNSRQKLAAPRNPGDYSEIEPNQRHQVEETFDDIFEKVKTKPISPSEKIQPTESNSKIVYGSSSSLEDIFEPRTPEIDESFSPDVFAIGSSPEFQLNNNYPPDDSNGASKPLKSILKKRAPAPPEPVQSTTTTETPIPPPRSIRKEEPAASKPITNEEENDDYLNWNLVERHRSSINQTVASQVHPDILRNVPSSLQNQSDPRQKFINSRAIQEAAPRTLRGMRTTQNQQSKSDSIFLSQNTRSSRDNESCASDASA
ncbi:uncharacterized protein LOC131439425 [Malaya genurostris]|uniref:uncharacterized protein LOC131439425 n=1 Tax=Malaya genurostris TaxID=325434 RepID=UPI0026F3ACF9|nr:uncharacterized protein LOC131439425 [Malaya genurostris]